MSRSCLWETATETDCLASDAMRCNGFQLENPITESPDSYRIWWGCTAGCHCPTHSLLPFPRGRRLGHSYNFHCRGIWPRSRSDSGPKCSQPSFPSRRQDISLVILQKNARIKHCDSGFHEGEYVGPFPKMRMILFVTSRFLAPHFSQSTAPKLNIAPWTWWLEDDPFLILGR